jgi:hypothetical protein
VYAFGPGPGAAYHFCVCFRESHLINGWQVWRWPLNLETKEEGLSTRPVRLLCAAARSQQQQQCVCVDHFLRQLAQAAFPRQNAELFV